MQFYGSVKEMIVEVNKYSCKFFIESNVKFDDELVFICFELEDNKFSGIKQIEEDTIFTMEKDMLDFISQHSNERFLIDFSTTPDKVENKIVKVTLKNGY